MNSTKLLLACLAIGFSASVLANSDIDSELEKCLENTSTTQSLGLCYKTATETWNRELNLRYEALIASASPQAKKSLKRSQESWEKYKQDYIVSVTDYYSAQDGTIWGIITAEAIMNVIKDKSLDLKRIVDKTDLCGNESC